MLWSPLLTVTASALLAVEAGAASTDDTRPDLAFLMRELYHRTRAREVA